jgi:hypothetical protein
MWGQKGVVVQSFMNPRWLLHVQSVSWCTCMLHLYELKYICRPVSFCWRATSFRLLFGANSLWAGRGFSRAAPARTRGLGSGTLTRETASFSYDKQCTCRSEAWWGQSSNIVRMIDLPVRKGIVSSTGLEKKKKHLIIIYFLLETCSFH